MTIAETLSAVFPQSVIDSVGGMYNLEMLVFSILVIAVFIGIAGYMVVWVKNKMAESDSIETSTTQEATPILTANPDEE